MNRIKQLRDEKGMNQTELGKIIGVTSQAMGMYENEKRGIDTNIASILADFFEVSIDYLMCKSDIRNPEKLDKELLDIGLSKKDYNPPTKEQQEKIEEFAKFVLKDNLKKKEDK